MVFSRLLLLLVVVAGILALVSCEPFASPMVQYANPYVAPAFYTSQGSSIPSMWTNFQMGGTTANQGNGVNFLANQNSYWGYGPTQDWYLRSGQTGGAVVLQDGMSGNVGVGTATPQVKLDVTGDARVSGTVTGSKLCLMSSGSGSGDGSVCIDAAALTMLNTAASRLSQPIIVSAKYGAGSSTVDVTSQLQNALATNPNTSVLLSNSGLYSGLADPANGFLKSTTISYIPPLSTVTKSIQITEGQRLSFSSLV
jgi:hypothetical protein